MSRPLFNSLGSNYSDGVVLMAKKSFWKPTQDNSSALKKLAVQLEKRFSGKSLFVYKGRDAIELVLQPLVEAELSHSSESLKLGVLTQGLACHAIEEGITRAGMVPVYVDLEKNTLGPSARTLQQAIERAEDDGITVKAVFIQHTLGYVHPLAEVEKFCRKYGLVLIEDLAQSFGAEESKGKEVGTRADAVIFSFGRDKVLDAVSGGAVVYTSKFWKKVGTSSEKWLKKHQPQSYPPLSNVRKEMLYPWLTRLVRNTHESGIGKVIFQLAKISGIFTSPIASPTPQSTKLPAAYAAIVLWQLENIDQQLRHRRAVAKTYLKDLQKVAGVKVLATSKRVNLDIHLRVPILFKTAKQMRDVITALKNENIYVSDRWYRTVVDSGSLGYSTLYQHGTCPEAEATAERLLNLPTHQFVSVQDAQRICHIIKKAGSQ